MANQYCAQCGAELESGARFCTECGASQSRKQDRRSPQANQSQNKLSWPMILLVVGALLLVGGAAFYLFYNPEPAPAITTNPPANTAEESIPYPEVARISAAEAKTDVDAGTAVLLDVRPQEDYQTLHAANAISIPDSEINHRFPELPQDVAIYTYCT
ncbi:MAG: zinc-ribbon domain-containing protein [Ardenticatenaceae bacterium]|nr:zinc-ribbon domain-containing protein [Ardenticatenaceae bacterium]